MAGSVDCHTSDTTTMTLKSTGGTKPCYLLDIPQELRDKILAWCLKDYRLSRNLTIKNGSYLSIPLVCRRLAQDYRDVVCKNTGLRVTLRNASITLKSRFVNLIQHIIKLQVDFEFGCCDDKCCFMPSDEESFCLWRLEVTLKDHMNDVARLSRQLPNLKTFEIQLDACWPRGTTTNSLAAARKKPAYAATLCRVASFAAIPLVTRVEIQRLRKLSDDEEVSIAGEDLDDDGRRLRELHTHIEPRDTVDITSDFFAVWTKEKGWEGVTGSLESGFGELKGRFERIVKKETVRQQIDATGHMFWDREEGISVELQTLFGAD